MQEDPIRFVQPRSSRTAVLLTLLAIGLVAAQLALG
jgi:hypothetical protein